jgi:hypothetical protein
MIAACSVEGRNFSAAHTYIVWRETPILRARSASVSPGTLAKIAAMG